MSRRPRTLALGGVLVVALVAGVVIAVTNPFDGGARASGVADNSFPTALTTVKRGPLSSQVTGAGTLGYRAQPDGSPYSLVNEASGTFTALPTVGRVIKEGQVIYRVTDNPVVLLNGSTPAYRSLSVGAAGPDVKELNADLVAMGYASASSIDPSSTHFSDATASALQQLQAKLGVSQTGSLGLGQAVLLPGPIRITKLTAKLGTPARPGTPIAQATSTRRQVQVNVDATQQASLRAGDRVVITLPDYRDTPGVVSRVGTVASGSGTSSPTIPVYIALDHPRDAGVLDQAPVRVQITTAGVPDALIVPINALLAQNGGGYAVETVDARRIHHLAPVSLGLFDDADGLVQVRGAGLAAGQRIVVPST
jgi:hypothetical protein